MGLLYSQLRESHPVFKLLRPFNLIGKSQSRGCSYVNVHMKLNKRQPNKRGSRKNDLAYIVKLSLDRNVSLHLWGSFSLAGCQQKWI